MNEIYIGLMVALAIGTHLYWWLAVVPEQRRRRIGQGRIQTWQMMKAMINEDDEISPENKRIAIEHIDSQILKGGDEQ